MKARLYKEVYRQFPDNCCKLGQEISPAIKAGQRAQLTALHQKHCVDDTVVLGVVCDLRVWKLEGCVNSKYDSSPATRHSYGLQYNNSMCKNMIHQISPSKYVLSTHQTRPSGACSSPTTPCTSLFYTFHLNFGGAQASVSTN